MIRSWLTKIKCICCSDKTIDMQVESICFLTYAALLPAANFTEHQKYKKKLLLLPSGRRPNCFSLNFFGKGAMCIKPPHYCLTWTSATYKLLTLFYSDKYIMTKIIDWSVQNCVVRSGCTMCLYYTFLQDQQLALFLTANH